MMNKRTLLWTNLTLWYFLCVGMVFDMYVCADNWKTGEVEEIKSLQVFFHRTNPGDYFMMKLGLLLVAIVCPIVFWKKSKSIRNLLLIALGVVFADMAFTIIHFLPINIYLGGYGTVQDFNPDTAKAMAQSWWTLNFVRIGLDFIGLVIAGRVLHKLYTDTELR